MNWPIWPSMPCWNKSSAHEGGVVMRQIILDTETTGLDAAQEHRIIEIGCLELVSRRPTGRHFHQYLNPERDIDEGAVAVHGITRARLPGEPVTVASICTVVDSL